MLNLDLQLYNWATPFGGGGTWICTTGASILDSYVLQETDIICETTVMG